MVLQVTNSITSQQAVLIAAALATIGWLYTSRKNRTLSRKQHTVNTMLSSLFDEHMTKCKDVVSPHLTAGECPDFNDPAHTADREAFRFVLNFYEFIAVGIRNGDFDEKMMIDSSRGTIIALFKCCEKQIYAIRNTRSRQSTYEHIEWLYKRWTKESKKPTRIIEWIRHSPLQGKRHNHHA